MAFFEEYFLNHYLQNGGFNVVDTLVYGAGLIVGVVLVYKLLKKLNVGLDRHFLIAILPLVFFASLTRAFRDVVYKESVLQGIAGFSTDLGINFNAVYTNSLAHMQSALPMPVIPELFSAAVTWFVTPGSYLITFLMALVFLFISLGIQKYRKIQYWKTMFVLGLLALVAPLAAHTTTVKILEPLSLVLLVAVPIAAVFFALSWFFKGKKQGSVVNYTSSAILSAHLLDAAATSVAINFYGFGEQHVVGNTLFTNLGGFYGAIGFFIAKIVVVLLAVWMFKADVKNERLRNFLLIIIIILGLAPGIRDVMSMLVL